MPKKRAARSGHKALSASTKSRIACSGKHSCNIDSHGRIFSLPNEVMENILDQLPIRDLKVLSATHQGFRVLIHRQLNKTISVKLPFNSVRTFKSGKESKHQHLVLPKTLTSIPDALDKVYFLHIKSPTESRGTRKVWHISAVLNSSSSLRHLSLDVGPEDLDLGSADSAITHIYFAFRESTARVDSLPLLRTFRAAIRMPRLRCLEIANPTSLLRHLLRDIQLPRGSLSIQGLSVISPCQAAIEGIESLLVSIVGLQSASFTFDRIIPYEIPPGMRDGAPPGLRPRLISFSLRSHISSLKSFKFIDAIENTRPVLDGWLPMIHDYLTPRVKEVVMPSCWFLSERFTSKHAQPFMLSRVETIQVQFIFGKSHKFPGVLNDLDGKPLQAIMRFVKAKKTPTVLPCLKEIIWWFQLRDQDTRDLKWQPKHLRHIQETLASAGISFRWIRAEHLNETPLESPFINEVGRYHGECETRVNFE